MFQISAQVVSGGRGDGGRGGSGRKPQHVVRKGAMGTACDACNRYAVLLCFITSCIALHHSYLSLSLDDYKLSSLYHPMRWLRSDF